MKLFIISLFFCVCALSLPPGHIEVEQPCSCAKPFKSTVKWTKGARGGYYCIATSRNNNEYKRYLSQWLKLK